MKRKAPPTRSLGFTLVEVMVALVIMAILALLSWQGVSGMSTAQARAQERSDAVMRLQTALAQWQTDLNAVSDTGIVSAIAFDGVSLRITRRDVQGNVYVVAWALRREGGTGGRSLWLRWQSLALANRADLLQAWDQAARWAQNPSDLERARETPIADADEWQIYYFRNDAWTNPQSADTDAAQATPPSPNPNPNAAAEATRTSIPDGLRLVIRLSEGQSLAGQLVRDWVRPTQGGGKS
jgi:general secretion pathway protein J